MSHLLNRQQGFSLLEVLLSLSLLSIGLLAIAQAQLSALRTIAQAHFLSLAELENITLIERWRSCQSDSHCIKIEMQQWHDNLTTLLPHVKATINQQGSDYQSRISWQAGATDPLEVILSFRP